MLVTGLLWNAGTFGDYCTEGQFWYRHLDLYLRAVLCRSVVQAHCTEHLDRQPRLQRRAALYGTLTLVALDSALSLPLESTAVTA
jgi:hypothetical protein